MSEPIETVVSEVTEPIEPAVVSMVDPIELEYSSDSSESINYVHPATNDKLDDSDDISSLSQEIKDKSYSAIIPVMYRWANWEKARR